jgi:hypothetical protein
MHQTRPDYLKMAEQAEAEAKRAADPSMQARWLKIAASYRELASPKALG